ncbi:MAG TPA: T9SS type A sorting domain-containing protein [Candidatus Kapabacteria bacterium]|nr:T9SS type A sorting domain-containing protein [Candidatus Kapabacteria bacterium]
MNRIIATLLLLSGAFWAGRVSAQVTQRDNFGTEFYVAFFPNEGGEVNRPIETLNTTDLYLTSRVPASGEVDVPALNFYQTFTTTPGQITTIVLPNGNNNSPSVLLPESADEQVTQGMAVHITSDSAIAVFGMNHKEYSSDAFMALPVNVLGTEYRTMNYLTSEPDNDGTTPGEFVIVAVQDSTNVTLTLHATSSTGTNANQPQTIRMNTGDVYLVQGDPRNGQNDLTGSLIESDHPIAVLSGHKRTEIPNGVTNIGGQASRDLLVEQLPPVSAWGDSALVVPYATSVQPDLVRVVCAEDGTQITVNGNPVPGTFNAGDFYEIPQLQGVTSIQASKPIEVGQYMHTSWGNLGDPRHPAYGDPALAMVYPVEQFDTAYTFVSVVNADAFTGNFVNIVADASSISTIILDGQPIPASEFKPIPNTRFDYAQHQLAQGTHNIYGAKPFGITVYALGPVDSYAYTGGTSLKTITPLETVGLVIDFGDRVLTGTAPNYTGTFDTTVPLINVSEDNVNIYSFPKRISDTDRFNVIKPIPSATSPFSIAPLTTDSFTIEFNPHEINRRMHTQITAATDHLRAYVVDVYGRGVQDDMGVFRDTNKVFSIDTIDFGTFTKTDAPGDSEVFVGNAGSDSMIVSSVQITGDVTDFTSTGILYNGAPVVPSFSIPQSPSNAARIGLQFTPAPTMINGLYTAQLTVSSTSADGSTSTHIVVLVAHIETISPLTLSDTVHAWGKTLVCDDSSFTISVPNPNDLPITITNATISGANEGDFVLSTKTPLVIPAGGTATVQVHFLPTGRGVKNAEAILNFDLPKNAKPDTVLLAGTGDKLSFELAAPQNIHSYALDPFFLVPIYAKTDITPLAADGYEIHVQYDSVHLKLIDVVTNGTLTPQGFPSLYQSTPPGTDTVVFQQGSGGDGLSGTTATPIFGGGPGSVGANDTFPDGLPLIYLKFQTVLAGADPQTFQEGFPITFDVIFNDAVIPYTCADHIFDSGYAQVDASCGTQYLETQPAFPSAMMLGQPTPNPTNAAVTVQYDVSTEGPITIDAVDAQGAIVATLVNDVKMPGYYTASLDASALPSGAYLLRMAADNYQSAKRFVIQK